MSGGTFKVRGGTGQAPTTVWFGKVPDRFTGLRPGYAGNNDSQITSFFAAHYVNQWVLYNPTISGGSNVLTASLGAFTTAPDGTTDKAQKLVEAATNTVHAAQALWSTDFIEGQGYRFRCSVFAKAAERTRFALYISNGGFDPDVGFGGFGKIGAKTVFNLANGTVAVANTTFDSGFEPYTALGTEIAPFGNGWYRCTMDVTMGRGRASGFNFYSFAVLLDNGSGAAAESTKYVGDGTSGIYFWRSTALPPGAWAINSQAFFDDFTTLNNIDMAGTLDPTKTWWLNNNWPGLGPGSLTPTDPTKISISGGTLLRIAPNSGQQNLAIMSAVWTGGTSYVASQVFSPPMLTECSMAWDDVNLNAAGPSWWSTDISRLLFDFPPETTGQSGTNEIDFFEAMPGGATIYPAMSVFYGPQGTSANLVTATVRAAWGPQKWHSTRDYSHPSFVVAYNGVIYQNSSPSINQQPDLFPAVWTVITASAAGYPANWIEFDYQALNTYSYLWLPYVQGDLGQVLTFSNDIYCGHLCYGPVLNNMPGAGVPPNAAPFHTGDGQAWPMMIGTSTNNNTYTDWVRVMT